MSGTWTWYANWSTGLLASSPLVCPEPRWWCAREPHWCALSLVGGVPVSLTGVP
jgi:hypothetical protein